MPARSFNFPNWNSGRLPTPTEGAHLFVLFETKRGETSWWTIRANKRLDGWHNSDYGMDWPPEWVAEIHGWMKLPR